MKTIIEMAREAGFDEVTSHKWVGYTNQIKSLIELARADEREACARICEEGQKHSYTCGLLIRARGNT